jgi:hypothetical protein
MGMWRTMGLHTSRKMHANSGSRLGRILRAICYNLAWWLVNAKVECRTRYLVDSQQGL